MVALVQVINNEESHSEEYCTATDNAVSALFSLLLSGMITGKMCADGVALFVDYLPMENDNLEAQTVHEKVVYALKNTNLFNSVRKEVLKKLPYMLFPTYDEGDNEIEISYEETKMEIVQILKSLNGHERMEIFRSLDPEIKTAVMGILGN